MAYYPCDRGPHYNPRKNFLVYLAVGVDGDFVRKRVRYCAAHLAEVQEDLAELEVLPEHATRGRWDYGATCLACKQPISEGGLELFVTCYPSKDERKDYWAKIHDKKCSDDWWTQIEAS